MEITVTTKYIRISPRKMRPVLFGLRGMKASEARTIAAFTNKKAAGFVKNILDSGLAAAKENYLEADTVTIKSIACNEGPRLKRMIPWSKGQSRRIMKKMAHLTLVLEAPDAPKKSKKITLDGEVK